MSIIIVIVIIKYVYLHVLIIYAGGNHDLHREQHGVFARLPRRISQSKLGRKHTDLYDTTTDPLSA